MPEAIYIDRRGVVELDPSDPTATVCGGCGRGWDDDVHTSVTPVPSGRCPFEYDHPDSMAVLTDEDGIDPYAIVGYDVEPDTFTGWTIGDSERAAREGWTIWWADREEAPGWEIQRFDTQDIPGGTQLTSDAEAWRIVYDRARAGSRVHRRALTLVYLRNRREYDRIIRWVQTHDPKEDAA